MADGRARIVAELAGQSQVVSGLKSIAGAVSGLASQALTAAGVLQGFNLAGAIEQAKQLDQQTAKLGQAAGRSGAELKRQFEGLEGRLLAPAPLLAQVTRQIGRLTYDTNYGARAIEGLGTVALATGRDIEEMTGLAGTLKDFGVDDVSRELGNVRDIAERMNTIGGPVALYDTLVAITPQLRQVAAESEGARKKIVALVADAGKGRSPAEQAAVAGGLLQALQSRAMDLERVTGKRQIDDQGNLLDPTAMAREIQRRALRANDGNKAAARRALIGRYGLEVGSYLATADFDKVEQTAAAAKDTGKTGAEAAGFRNTDAARRMAAELRRKAAERTAGEQALPVIDKVTDALGPWGVLFGGSVLGAGAKGLSSLLLGKGAGGAAAGAAKALATSGSGLNASLASILGEGGAGANAAINSGLLDGTLKAGGAAGGAALAGVAATAAAQVYAVSQLGEDRGQMGQKWRSKQAETIGAEIAAQAQQKGDLIPVIGKAQGDQAAITAALLLLEKQFDKLPDRLADQVAQGLSASLQRAPIYARVERDPKDQSVN